MTPADLRTIRAALGLSQARLARLLGVTTMTVSSWERGVKRIGEPAARLVRLFEAGPGWVGDFLEILAKGAREGKRGSDTPPEGDSRALPP